MSIQDIKTTILTETEKAVEKSFSQKPEGLRLGFPPDIALGDFTVECFPLAKQFHQNPTQIAQKAIAGFTANALIQEVKAIGPYLNFKVSPTALFDNVCSEIISQGQNFGNSSIGQNQRVMVEYLSPNTNKSLHLGHLRNGALGMAIANLLSAVGFNIIKASLINDRGVPICKSMLAWQKWAKGETPETVNMKGDNFVGKWYVRYTQEEEQQKVEPLPATALQPLEKKVQTILQKWEAGDQEIISLWQKMNFWVYQGFSQTYKTFGLEFDVFYYESNTYKLGKDIIAEGIKKKVFYKDERGAIVFDLPQDEFGLDKDGSPKKATVLRADGTSVYLTQDLGTALLKIKEHRLDRSIYVVGSEQIYYFKTLFKILEALGYVWAKGLYHLSYGMVYLPAGKMKSREGKIVEADDLIAKVTNLAAEEIEKRDPENKLSEVEIQKRAAKIGVGAIKFYLLRVSPQQDIHFDPKESISFDGTTGPYCQYAYARCSGILRKAQQAKINLSDIDFSLLGNQEERLLIKKLLQFPEEAESAAVQFNPGRVAVHLYETAQTFNQFYHQHPVLAIENQELIKARLLLVQATSIVLKKGLNLLGIEALEEM